MQTFAPRPTHRRHAWVPYLRPYYEPMRQTWPVLNYDAWAPTCDTLHAHTQLLGKLAVALAPPEPQLQHAALRLTTRGWETSPLPVPDGSGAITAALDLHRHEAVVEHSDGRVRRLALAPDRAVADVTQEILQAVAELAGTVRVNVTPQEVPWTTPIDEDHDHATYNPDQVETYFTIATMAALVLARLRAPYRGRSTRVNAWWGSFDLAISLFSGRDVEPPSEDFIVRNSADSEQIEIGWWPGDARYPRSAFYAFATPAPPRFHEATLTPPAARWNAELGEFLFDWDDAVETGDPVGSATGFGLSAIRHACAACGWDPVLAASAEGSRPPVV